MKVSRILLLSAVSLLQFVAAHYILIQQFPNSGDEHSYLFQARLFSSGKLFYEDPLYSRAHPLNKYVKSQHLADVGQKRFSKYPPGWPLLLCLGVLGGVEGIINPILGALLVLFILLHVRQKVGEKYVLLSWLLLTFCSFFYLNNASFGSHTSTMTILFITFYIYDGVSHRSSSIIIFICGCLLGYVSLIRYIDFVPLGLWMGASILLQKRFLSLIPLVLGFAAVASVHLLYNDLLSSRVLTTPTQLYSAGGLHDSLHVSWIGFAISLKRLLILFGVFPPVLLLLLLLYKYYRFFTLKGHLMLVLMNFGVYYFYIGAVGGSHNGPRYILAYFPFAVIAVTELYKILENNNCRRLILYYKAFLVLLVVVSLRHTVYDTYEIYMRRDLERTVESLEVDKKIILLITPPI